MKSCLICDDHAIMREALCATISKGWPDCRIVMAEDYPSAWKEAESAHDLCITDLVMPGSDPITGVTKLMAIQPDMPLIVLTGSFDDNQMMQLLSVGISGFVPKSSSGNVIEAAVGLVLAGGRYLPPEVLALVENFGQPVAAVDAAALTRQQRRVLEHLAQGMSNKEIAASLGVAPSTIKFHVDSLLDRLNAKNRAEIVSKGKATGLL
jgi:DNA-binding NarL/FixJ family response regulator